MASQGLGEINKRKNTIEKTVRVTKVLKTATQNKFSKCSTLAYSSNEFIKRLNRCAYNIIEESKYKGEEFCSNNGAEGIVHIVIGSDKGMCGSYNKDILNFIKDSEDESVNDNWIVIGDKLSKIFKDNTFNIESTHALKDIDNDYIENLVKELQRGYKEDKFNEAYVLYTHYHSALNKEIVKKRLLPLKAENGNDSNGLYNGTYTIEGEVGKYFAKFFLEERLYNAYINASLSEEGMRLDITTNAEKSGNEIMDELKVQYNNLRQSKITSEISEIVSGVEALN